jgi:hypothetical protein
MDALPITSRTASTLLPVLAVVREVLGKAAPFDDDAMKGG